jgi:hypothetical protein
MNENSPSSVILLASYWITREWHASSSIEERHFMSVRGVSGQSWCDGPDISEADQDGQSHS